MRLHIGSPAIDTRKPSLIGVYHGATKCGRLGMLLRDGVLVKIRREFVRRVYLGARKECTP